MEDRKYKIKLFLYDEPELERDVEFYKNDTNTCIMNISLFKDRSTKYLVDGTVSILINKPDGTEVVDILMKLNDGEYIYELPNSAINVVGNHTVTVQCTGSNNDRTTFMSFKYKIKNVARSEDIYSENDYPILTKLLSDNYSLSKQVNAAEALRGSNEEVRKNNEETRKSNETLRQANFDKAIKEYESYKNVMIAESNVAALQNQINAGNAQLAEKAQKEDVRLKYVKITQSDVSEELLQQIAGNTPINSIPADGSVTLSKTTFQPVSNGVLGKNLFDKTRCKIDKGLSNNTGLETIAQGYFASDFIPVIEGQKYTISKMNQGAFYDKNKAYVSDNTMNYFPAIKKTITVPTGVSFFRFSNMINIIDNIQMELGILTTDYEPYGYVLRDKSVGSNQIKDKAIKTANIDDYTIQLPHIGFPIAPFHKSKNLFNKDDITTDMFVSYINGNLSSNTSYVASNYIKIEANTNYTINYFDQIAWYDENKVYISGVDGYQLGVKTITSPSNAVYMRLSVRKTALDSYQLEEGTTSTTFEDFGVSITEHMLHKNLLNKLDFQRINNVMNKLILSDTTINIKLIGDSITHGQGGTGFAQDGDLIYDAGWSKWHVNTNGYCWANSFKTFAESKFNCLVKNYGMTGANSETIKVAIQNNKLVEDTDDIIILCVGTNDRNIGSASGDKLRLYNNISTIVDLIKSKGKKVILMSNIPSSIENETDNKAFHMEDVDHIIMKIASEKAMEYISIYKLFIEYCKSKNITIDSLLKDGLHPNNDGYDVMFYLICTALGFGVKRDGATW